MKKSAARSPALGDNVPQPLNRVLDVGQLLDLVQGPSCLTNFPEFASAVVETIAFGAHAEHEQGRILTDLLGGSPSVGMATYFAQQSADARRRLVRIAADVQLAAREQERELFDLVWRALASVRGQRNSFAHGIWGFTPSLPDAVLLADTDEIAKADLRRLTGDFADMFGSEYTYVYRRSDFQTAVENARQASNAASSLRSYLLATNSVTKAGLRRSLLDMPLIRGLLPQPS